MNEKFSVISENNLKYIDFHDCECSRLYYENYTLVFEMDWMEVLSEHPMNPRNKAHQSGEEMVMLQLPTIEQLVLYKNNSEIISVNDLNNVDFRDTILLQYDESKTNDGYKAKIYLLFNNNKEFDSALIEISYNKSVAMWDDELTVYKDKEHPLPADAWSFVDNVKIMTKDAHIFAPLLVLR